jgi:hypothetical protein
MMPDAVHINTGSHFQELFEATAPGEYQVMFSERRRFQPGNVVTTSGVGLV